MKTENIKNKLGKKEVFNNWLNENHSDFMIESSLSRLLPIIMAGALSIGGVAGGEDYSTKGWTPEARAAFDRLPEPEKKRVYDFVKKRHLTKDLEPKELPTSMPISTRHDPKVGPVMKNVLQGNSERQGLEDYKGRRFTLKDTGVMIWKNGVMVDGMVNSNGTDIRVRIPQGIKVNPKTFAASYYCFRNALSKDYAGEFIGFKEMGTSEGKNGSKIFHFHIAGQQSIRNELQWVRGVTGINQFDSAYNVLKNVQRKAGNAATQNAIKRYNQR